jgi:hypothetical protein
MVGRLWRRAGHVLGSAVRDGLLHGGRSASQRGQLEDVASYGFRNTGSVYSSSLNPGPSCADDLTIRYVDIGGPLIGNVFTTTMPSSGFYFGGFGDVCERWTISRNHIHNVVIPLQIAGGDRHVIEANWIGPAFSKEAIRGQIRASNNIIRNNVLRDSCQLTPGDSTSGCTAEIALWAGDAAGAFSGNEIYGNIFQKTTNEHNSGWALSSGGTASAGTASPRAAPASSTTRSWVSTTACP